MRDYYMAGKKYWKISRVVMVITSENNSLIMHYFFKEFKWHFFNVEVNY